jgi:hypothetical protein
MVHSSVKRDTPDHFPLKSAAKIPIEKSGVEPLLQTGDVKNTQNRDYELYGTRRQRPRPQPWPMCQSKHTGGEGGHIQLTCPSTVAANALCKRYDHRNRRTSGTTIRRCIVPKIVIKIVITIFFGRSAQIPAKSEKVIVRPEERKDIFTNTPIFVD